MTTDGYRTNSDMARDTYYFKYLQPVGQNTTITLLSSVNRIIFGNPGTVTQQQIDTSGRNFGLDPNNAADHLDLLNRKYNYQNKKADFEYIGLDSKLDHGWSVENKVYTYYYDNISHEKPKVGSGAAAGQMLGSVKLNEYRTYGDTFAIVNQSEIGTFKAGVWVDSTTNHRYTYGVNYDTTGSQHHRPHLGRALQGGGPEVAIPRTFARRDTGYDYKYLLVDQMTRSFQPFAEYEWKVTHDFNINAGVRYQQFTRDMNATVNQTSGRRGARSTPRTDSKATPSLTAHYSFNQNWAAYAEIAQGFQAPKRGQFLLRR